MASDNNISADHEYHEISDEENQGSPLRFDKALSFDLGPSLLDEMDQMFRSLGNIFLMIYRNIKILFYNLIFDFFLPRILTASNRSTIKSCYANGA